MKLQSNFTPKDSLAAHDTSRWWLLICWSGKQQEIAIRIFDDEIFGAPRLLFQFLMKGNASRLKFKKQQLDLVGCRDGHGCRQQFFTIADRLLKCKPLDTPKIETRCVATHLRIVGRVAVTEYQRKT